MKEKLALAIEYAINDKCFLDKELTLHKMAELQDTNTAYVSKIVNSVYGKRFSDFINDYRIKHALYLLEENVAVRRYTIEYIDSLSGFHSTSAFYNAFKKCTGNTPANYIKLLTMHKHSVDL